MKMIRVYTELQNIKDSVSIAVTLVVCCLKLPRSAKSIRSTHSDGGRSVRHNPRHDRMKEHGPTVEYPIAGLGGRSPTKAP